MRQERAVTGSREGNTCRKIGCLRDGGQMKALVLGDEVAEILHSGKVRSHCQGADLILSTGDLPADYLEYVVTMLNVPMLYVLGNHDRPWELQDGEMIDGPRGGENVDEQVICLDQPSGDPLCVAGLEGSPWYNGEGHQYTKREMRRKASRLARRLHIGQLRGRRLGVLLTHAAPKGIHDAKGRAHRGFDSILHIIRRFQPRYAIHGHVHPSYGYDTKPRIVGRTTVLNVYRYAFLEIDP